MKIKVYVLKEWRNDQAYKDENIRTYATREEATNQLRKDVEEWAGVSWDDLPKWAAINEKNVFNDDYISLNVSGR